MSWAMPFPLRSSNPARSRAARATSTALLAVLLACLGAGPAAAQTCEAPQTLRTSPQPSTTCGGDLSITSVCNGEIAIYGPVGVWQLRVGAGATAVLELLTTDPVFSPVGYLVAASGSCGEGGCHGHVDPLTPLDLSVVPPGHYHLIVAASEWDAPGACGKYGLALSGELGDFDLVFADGFD